MKKFSKSPSLTFGRLSSLERSNKDAGINPYETAERGIFQIDLSKVRLSMILNAFFLTFFKGNRKIPLSKLPLNNMKGMRKV